jgi:hypothetical protein
VEKEIEIDPLGAETFPEQWKEEFEGLLYLGYLRKQVKSIPFHTFVVRTLTINDKLEVSLVTKEFQDTLGYGRAYRAAIVAAGLESVDGRELVPASRGTNTFRQKFDYVINNWYDPVIDLLYREIDELEGTVLVVLHQLNIINLDTAASSVFKDEQETSSDNPKDGK